MDNLIPPLSIVTIVNLIISGSAVLYFRKNGGPKVAQDVIELYKIRDNEQKTQLADYQFKYENLKQQFGALEAKVEEKDKKLQEYLEIFRGRSPEQTTYQEHMLKFTEGVSKYMDQTSTILQGVVVSLDHLNTAMKNSEQMA